MIYAKIPPPAGSGQKQKLGDAGTLLRTAPQGDWLVGYFGIKPLYEGTHAVYNYYSAARRYLNLLDRAGEAMKVYLSQSPINFGVIETVANRI
ncbi:MAG: hypothetical protein ACE5PV_09455 [Candidatus Poribacteria bacterium]